jgi:hypothetical protein
MNEVLLQESVPMLPQPLESFLVSFPGPTFRAGILMLAVLVTVVAGCGESQTPDAIVRAVIAQGEQAAEARDLSAIMDLVAPSFEDGQGGGRDELKQYLRGYLVAHQSIHLLSKVESVEFPYRDLAKVSLTVGTLGREAAAATAFDLAADVYDVELELKLDDGEWRVTRASWRSAAN